MACSIVRAMALLASAGIGGAVSAQESTAREPCSLAADSTSLDTQAGTGTYRGIRVSCDGVTILADEATSSEFAPRSREWQFRGNIRIEVDSAVLTADLAQFSFSENGLMAGELAGDPAVLEDFIPEENTAVRATAGRIRYDNVARTARMENGASLVLGTSEMSGCGDIIYDLERGLVDTVSDCDEPFVIKFLPPQNDDESAAGEDPPPQ